MRFLKRRQTAGVAETNKKIGWKENKNGGDDRGWVRIYRNLTPQTTRARTCTCTMNMPRSLLIRLWYATEQDMTGGAYACMSKRHTTRLENMAVVSSQCENLQILNMHQHNTGKEKQDTKRSITETWNTFGSTNATTFVGHQLPK